MNILKIMAEKIYGCAGVYGMKATVWFETDDGDEMTAVYATDGADGSFTVYNDLIDSVDKVTQWDEESVKEYDGDENAADSEYGDAFAVAKKAIELIDG